MDINSDKAKAFFQLAKDKSFSKASKSLGISQSALSQKIAKLEDELETTLVIRTTKSISLTEIGRKFVQYYKTKMVLDSDFLSSISSKEGQINGQIRVAGFSSITRSIIIPLLKDTITESRISFNISSHEIHELESLLVSGNTDFIITSKPIKKDNIVNELIGREELVHITPRTVSSSLPFLDHDELDETTFNFFSKQNKQIDYKRCYLDEIYNIIKGVESEIGQAVVSKHLVSKNKKVRIVNYKTKVFSDIYISYFKRPYYSELQKLVISLFISNFSKHA